MSHGPWWLPSRQSPEFATICEQFIIATARFASRANDRHSLIPDPAWCAVGQNAWNFRDYISQHFCFVTFWEQVNLEWDRGVQGSERNAARLRIKENAYL